MGQSEQFDLQAQAAWEEMKSRSALPASSWTDAERDAFVIGYWKGRADGCNAAAGMLRATRETAKQ